MKGSLFQLESNKRVNTNHTPSMIYRTTELTNQPFFQNSMRLLLYLQQFI